MPEISQPKPNSSRPNPATPTQQGFGTGALSQGSSGAIDNLFQTPEMQRAARTPSAGPAARTSFGNFRNPSPNSLNGNKPVNLASTPGMEGRERYQRDMRNMAMQSLINGDPLKSDVYLANQAPLTSQEMQYVKLMKMSIGSGIPLALTQDELGTDEQGMPIYGDQRLPTIDEFQRRIDSTKAWQPPSVPLSAYFNTGSLSGIYDAMEVANAPAVMAMNYAMSFPSNTSMLAGLKSTVNPLGNPSTFQVVSPDNVYLDLAKRVSNEKDSFGLTGYLIPSPENFPGGGSGQFSLAYQNDPYMDAAMTSLRIANTAGTAAATGGASSLASRGLASGGAALSRLGANAGFTGTAARTLEPIARGAQVAFRGVPQAQGGSRFGNLFREGVTETLGNLQPGILAQGEASVGRLLNSYFAANAANSAATSAIQNAMQSYDDKGSIFEAGVDGLRSGLANATIEPTARLGSVINAVRLGEGFGSGINQAALQHYANQNPDIAQDLNSPDPIIRQQAENELRNIVRREDGFASMAGTASKGLGYLAAPFLGSTYVGDTYAAQRAQAQKAYADEVYSPESLHSVFSGDLQPANMRELYERGQQDFGPAFNLTPQQNISYNIGSMLQSYYTLATQQAPEVLPYLQYLYSDFNQSGATPKNMAAIGLFRDALLSNDDAKMKAAIEHVDNLRSISAMQNGLTSNAR